MTNFGIFAGTTPVSVEKLEKVQGSQWVGVYEGVLPMGGVFVGSEQVWPTYREELHWYDFGTPGATDSGANHRLWEGIAVPEWASVVDVVLCPSGGRGEDGARGFGNNDGRGGYAGDQRSSSLPLVGDSIEVYLSRPTSFQTNPATVGSTHFAVSLGGVIQDVEQPVGARSGSGSTGASMPVHAAFGRTWPGGTGGALNQPGQGYGAAGGGGQGAPPIGGDRRNGQYGAPGYAALRLRSGPVPDGHTWPGNPDWVNPQ